MTKEGSAISTGLHVAEIRSVRLGAHPEQTLRFVGELRDSLRDGTPLAWRGDLVASIDVGTVCHLPPPQGPGELAAAWRARYRPGLCYYRHGPGFLQVKDVRDPDASASFVIDAADTIRTFNRCLQPTQLAGLDGPERETVEALTDEGLLLVMDGWAVTLPHRMRRWPVPALDI